ncbi:hypothetical protein D3M59_02250 [Sphingomonas edaphi]|uniref:Glycosyltransferase RgtA/B/C/D-like domain-containing protein n=1 Tax=Sphingomonas edaphi TaxID=2315689 RepID=A0A418Q212_9SPHN|nr:hypothetical protein D3M59_02250 [Sphingomonas edaphi]
MQTVQPVSKGGERLAAAAPAFAIIIAVAIATRIVSWWNPVAHVDDQFYLLAGQELLRGHWPYLDVWDRKPLGLFVVYALVAAIGGGSIIALNLVATAFAAATAMTIRQIALRFTSPIAALMAAVTYLVVLPLYGGQNGQSPVFYNLLIAGAVLLLFRSIERKAAIVPNALVAMLLCGLAMTIKQTTFVEGAFVGLGFLWLLHHSGRSLAFIVGAAIAMVGVALSPTLACFVTYWLQGPASADAYVYANFVSIFERQSWSPLARVAGVGLLFLYLFPLFIMSGIGMVSLARVSRWTTATALLAGWLGAALLGYLSVPAFFDHYALPLISPLCVAAAIFYDLRPGRLFFAGYMAFCLIQGSILDWPDNRREAALYRDIRETVRQAKGDGCVYVADGPSRLYMDFPDCRPTRYLFPDHLVLITERDAVGVDTADELSLILAARPAVVVTRKARKGRHPREIIAILRQALGRDYRPVLRTADGESKSVDGVTVWQLKVGPRAGNVN